jgi:hypothetical protein
MSARRSELVESSLLVSVNLMSARRSELVESSLLVSVNLKDLVEPGNSEDFKQVGVNAAKLQLAFDRCNLLLEVDQLAERGAGKVLNIAEIQQEILVTFVLNQAVKLVADFLDVFLGHDLGFNETDNGHSVNVF